MLNRKLVGEDSDSYGRSVNIPANFVALVGQEKAGAFLKRALTESKSLLQVESGTPAAALAKKIAHESMAGLKTPQWQLVNSLSDAELYEALEKRFAKPAKPQAGAESDISASVEPANYQRRNAQMYYLLGLIAQQRTAEAVAVANKFEKEDNFSVPSEALVQMERAGFTRQLNEFFHQILSENPELPFWDEYVQAAAHAGATEEMVKLVQSTTKRAGVSKKQALRLQQLLHRALLATDNIEQGVSELRQVMKSTEGQPSVSRYEQEDRAALGLRLAQIGYLLNQNNWLEEGLAAAKESLQKDSSQAMWQYSASAALPMFLIQIGRGAEAEAVLSTALQKIARLESERPEYGYSTSAGQPFLAGLVKLYHGAARYRDVLQVFDSAPYWGSKDLAEFRTPTLFAFNRDQFTMHQVETPIALYAAAALAKTDRVQEARRIVDALLGQEPGSDRLYELLLELDPEGAPSALDKLFTLDQFEERPLIWKAHWLRLHNQLQEAEQVARKAMSIDPTDGEEGPGDRLRAYSELAEIRAARGDAKEADFLRSIVSAVRQSERADQFYAAGLLKRAVDLYQNSLSTFADAYCIHARLAVRLAELGQHAEAEEHYRRAYELMPEQFGRMESHCFGCEQTFAGEKAQAIAEKVFSSLVQKSPEKPQVHYLLGYLREEQARYAEALKHYQQAVQLDPDYLNAWVKMQGLTRHILMPGSEKDAIAVNLIRLDPAQRHSSVSFESASDIPKLWTALSNARQSLPKKPATVYPLAASAERLQKKPESARMRSRYEYMEEREQVAPSRVLLQNVFIQAAAQILDHSTED